MWGLEHLSEVTEVMFKPISGRWEISINGVFWIEKVSMKAQNLQKACYTFKKHGHVDKVCEYVVDMLEDTPRRCELIWVDMWDEL